MLEIIKIRKDINWLIDQIKCLIRKEDLSSPLSATEWSSNHSTVTGNAYPKDCFVWYAGNVYKSLTSNNTYPPTNATHWANLGLGHLLLEEQTDWDSTGGRNYLKNKPVNLSDFNNDTNFITAEEATTGTILGDIPVVLGGNRTLGKYTSGQTILSTGWTFEELIRDIALEYVAPVFTSFTIPSLTNIVEVGTTLSGTKTFNWAITQNSGIVETFGIYDNKTDAFLDTGISGNTVDLAIVTNLMNTEGEIQNWKVVGDNTAVGHIGTIDSFPYTVTARYKRWWGACDVEPTDRASALTLPNSGFQTSAVNNFILNTGTTKLKMVVLLPPGRIIDFVYDATNNASITSSYIFSTVNINDANGVPRTYNKYVLSLGSAYNPSAEHVIQTKAI